MQMRYIINSLKWNIKYRKFDPVYFSERKSDLLKKVRLKLAYGRNFNIPSSFLTRFLPHSVTKSSLMRLKSLVMCSRILAENSNWSLTFVFTREEIIEELRPEHLPRAQNLKERKNCIFFYIFNPKSFSSS